MKKLIHALYHLFVPGALERTLRHHFRNHEELKATAKSMGLDDVVTLANLGQFLAICSMDISQLSRHVLIAWPSWKRRLHARHLMLAIYELNDDIPQILGKRMRTILARGPSPDRHLAALTNCRTSLAALLRDARAQLHEVRTVTAAHRDHDATLLLKTIDGIDVAKTRDLGIEIQGWCSDTIHVLGAAAQEYNDTKIKELANQLLHRTQ